jgi:hypothetical protein
MTIVASLLFLTALGLSVGAIFLTVRNAMPRIREVVAMEFAGKVARERRITCGEMRRRTPATIIAFPVAGRGIGEMRLAAEQVLLRKRAGQIGSAITPPSWRRFCVCVISAMLRYRHVRWRRA